MTAGYKHVRKHALAQRAAVVSRPWVSFPLVRMFERRYRHGTHRSVPGREPPPPLQKSIDSRLRQAGGRSLGLFRRRRQRQQRGIYNIGDPFGGRLGGGNGSPHPPPSTDTRGSLPVGDRRAPHLPLPGGGILRHGSPLGDPGELLCPRQAETGRSRLRRIGGRNKEPGPGSDPCLLSEAPREGPWRGRGLLPGGLSTAPACGARRASPSSPPRCGTGGRRRGTARPAFGRPAGSDPLLAGHRASVETALAAAGCEKTLEGARSFPHDWCDTMQPEYPVASTPHDFVLPGDRREASASPKRRA
mmetsp:Transcript_102808/g.209543  ORF Transcript_102808/g.209543 Transcript_102808/m.209543 type:complete len:303 (+) Transcript_102808:3803-4711(+)